MVMALIFVLYTYVLLIGFFFYAAVIASWDRLKTGIRVLVVPWVLLFGAVDVVFDLVFGTLLYLELPGWLGRRFTFSSRCEYHLHDAGFRGVIAAAYCYTLNSISPGHCKG